MNSRSAGSASAAKAIGRRGRPRKTESLSVMMPVRLLPEQAAFCRALGGSAFVRSLIERERARWRAAAADASEPTAGESPMAPPAAAQAVPPSLAGAEASEPLALSRLLGMRSESMRAVIVQKTPRPSAGVSAGDVLLLDGEAPLAPGCLIAAKLDGRWQLCRLAAGPEGELALLGEDGAELKPKRAAGPKGEVSIEIAGVAKGIVRRLP